MLEHIYLVEVFHIQGRCMLPKYKVDNFAIYLSMLFVFHYLFIPKILNIYPSLYSEDVIFHQVLTAFVIIISCFVFTRSYFYHKCGFVFGVAIAGIILLGVSALNINHRTITVLQERIITFDGIALIVSAQLLNYRLFSNNAL